jgi:serine/threonine protein kinase/tetratricopeptide (TPR) repeat protein
VIGKIILHYKILEKLGEGGMGVVYRAEDTKLKRNVAIKFLPKHISANEEERERFKIEAQAAAALSHPNIATIFNIEEAEDEVFIVMEYIDGQELKEIIGAHRNAPMPIKDIINYAAQISAGLQAAHEKGIVHRDIKSANIMITDKGQVKIMDFGLAKMYGSPHMTKAGSTVGTPYYMAPEQARGEEIDQRTDIWSLGVVLYEMLTGELPFKGEYEQAVIYTILNEEPPVLFERRPEIPAALETIVGQCLQKDASQRYQTIKETNHDLEVLRDASRPSSVTVAVKPRRKEQIFGSLSRQSAIIPIAAVLVAVVIAMLLYGKFTKKNAPPEKTNSNSIAVMYFENRSAEKDLDKVLVDMLTTNLARNKQFEVVSSQRLFDILKNMGKLEVGAINKSVATEVAKEAHVSTMVLGSIIQIGSKFRITSQLIKVNTGDIIASDQVEGNQVEDIFAMVDELTEKISNQLIASGEEATKQPLRIADATTSSYRAYQFYQKGLEYEWRWDFQNAAKNFRRAIQIDSTFAMAHLELAVSLYIFEVRDHYADLAPARKLISAAERHSQHAGEKEQLYIMATKARYDRHYQRAMALFSDFVKRYPEEKDGWFQLSVLHFFHGYFSQSLTEMQRALQLDPAFANAQNLLGYILVKNNRPQEAITAIKKYIDLQPDVENTYDSAWEICIMAGELDSALAICQRALAINPNWRKYHRYAAYTYLFKGDEKTAFSRLHQSTGNNPDEDPWILRNIGYFYVYQGDYEAALTSLDNAIRAARTQNDSSDAGFAMIHRAKLLTEMRRFDQARTAFREVRDFSRTLYSTPVTPVDVIGEYGTGVIYVKEGNLEKAKRQVQKIFELVKSNHMDSLFNDYAYLLQAEFRLKNGEAQASLEALHHVNYSINSPQLKLLESQALARSGKIEEAVATLDEAGKNIVSRGPWLGGGDYFEYFYLRSHTPYLQGKFYEQNNDIPRAVEYYHKAVEQWKHANNSLAELKDARERLAKREGVL